MRIGILGGTFDPVHNGHYHIARETSRIFRLDRIIFMVSKEPPHKGKVSITDAFHRFAMVAIQLADEDRMLAGGNELARNGPSYTIETLEEISETHPDFRVCFIAGSDSLKEIHCWRDCGRLFAEFCLIFVQRPEAEVDLALPNLPLDLRNRIRKAGRVDRLEIRPGVSFLLDLDAPSFSSSAIRRAVGSGQPVPEGSLTPQVLRYIRKNRLYEEE